MPPSDLGERCPSTMLLLFDIDGTLLLSGGAGLRALNRTFEELFGVPDGFNGICVPGRTDALIFKEAVARAGLRLDEDARGRFQARYCEYLQEEILHPGPRKGLMPGVPRLLDELDARRDVCSALLTGNFTRAAQIKLEHFGLWRYFACGAYGDDAPSRNQLVPIVVERARTSGVEIGSFTDVVVVGDTPLDVECAAVVGARSVGVATGSYDEAALHDSGADLVLSDLTDTRALFDLLGTISGPRTGC